MDTTFSPDEIQQTLAQYGPLKNQQDVHGLGRAAMQLQQELPLGPARQLLPQSWQDPVAAPKGLTDMLMDIGGKLGGSIPAALAAGAVGGPVGEAVSIGGRAGPALSALARGLTEAGVFTGIQDPQQFGEQIAPNAAMFGGMNLARLIPNPLARAAASAAVGGGVTAAQGGTGTDVGVNSLLMGLLGLPGAHRGAPRTEPAAATATPDTSEFMPLNPTDYKPDFTLQPQGGAMTGPRGLLPASGGTSGKNLLPTHEQIAAASTPPSLDSIIKMMQQPRSPLEQNQGGLLGIDPADAAEQAKLFPGMFGKDLNPAPTGGTLPQATFVDQNADLFADLKNNWGFTDGDIATLSPDRIAHLHKQKLAWEQAQPPRYKQKLAWEQAQREVPPLRPTPAAPPDVPTELPPELPLSKQFTPDQWDQWYRHQLGSGGIAPQWLEGESLNPQNAEYQRMLREGRPAPHVPPTEANLLALLRGQAPELPAAPPPSSATSIHIPERPGLPTQALLQELNLNDMLNHGPIPPAPVKPPPLDNLPIRPEPGLPPHPGALTPAELQTERELRMMEAVSGPAGAEGVVQGAAPLKPGGQPHILESLIQQLEDIFNPAPTRPGNGQSARPLPGKPTAVAEPGASVAVESTPTPEPAADIVRQLQEIFGSGGNKLAPGVPIEPNGARMTAPPGPGETRAPNILQAFQNRQEPTTATAAPSGGVVGKTVTGITPDVGTEHQFQWEVLPLDSLLTSDKPGFPAQAQPRTRGSQADSVAQVERIAMKPRLGEMLGDVGRTDMGTPTVIDHVNPDGTVIHNVTEVGNGRTDAFRLMLSNYPQNMEAYQAALLLRLPEVGIDPAAVAGMKNPILVRRRLDTKDQVKYVNESNDNPMLQMSNLEQAFNEADKISDSALATFKIGENQTIAQALRSPANDPLVNEFIAATSPNQRATLRDGNAQLSNAGIDRIQAALLTRTYTGDAGRYLAQLFIESADPLIKNVENGMMASLPRMAKAEELMDQGLRDPSLKLGDELAQAVATYSQLKQNGIEVEAHIPQQSMFGTEPETSPLQATLLRFLDQNSTRSSAVKKLLNTYANEVINQPPPDKLIESERPTRDQLLAQAIAGAEAPKPVSQTPLFAAPEAPGAAGLMASVKRKLGGNQKGAVINPFYSPDAAANPDLQTPTTGPTRSQVPLDTPAGPSSAANDELGWARQYAPGAAANIGVTPRGPAGVTPPGLADIIKNVVAGQITPATVREQPEFAATQNATGGALSAAGVPRPPSLFPRVTAALESGREQVLDYLGLKNRFMGSPVAQKMANLFSSMQQGAAGARANFDTRWLKGLSPDEGQQVVRYFNQLSDMPPEQREPMLKQLATSGAITQNMVNLFDKWRSEGLLSKEMSDFYLGAEKHEENLPFYNYRSFADSDPLSAGKVGMKTSPFKTRQTNLEWLEKYAEKYGMSADDLAKMTDQQLKDATFKVMVGEGLETDPMRYVQRSNELMSWNLNQAKFLDSIAHDDSVFQKLPEGQAPAGENWVRVRDTLGNKNNLGPLGDANGNIGWIQKDAVPFLESLNDPKLQGWARVSSELTRMWKLSKTVYNPAIWLRDFLSHTMVHSMLAGYPVALDPKGFMDSMLSAESGFFKDSPLRRQLAQAGLYDSTNYLRADLKAGTSGQLSGILGDIQQGNQPKKSLGQMWRESDGYAGTFFAALLDSPAGQKAIQGMEDNKLTQGFGSMYDSIAHYLAFKYLQDHPGDFEGAARFGRHYIGDFGNLPAAVRKMSRGQMGLLNPFISYPYVVAKITADVATSRPWVLGVIPLAVAGLNATLGPDADQAAANEPGYIHGQALNTPLSNRYGNPYYMPLGRVYAPDEFATIIKGMATGNLEDAGKLAFGGPVASLMNAYLGRDINSGQALYPENAPAAERHKAQAGYVAQNVLPVPPVFNDIRDLVMPGMKGNPPRQVLPEDVGARMLHMVPGGDRAVHSKMIDIQQQQKGLEQMYSHLVQQYQSGQVDATRFSSGLQDIFAQKQQLVQNQYIPLIQHGQRPSPQIYQDMQRQ